MLRSRLPRTCGWGAFAVSPPARGAAAVALSAAAAGPTRRSRRRETRLERFKRRWFAYFFGLVVPVGIYAIFVGYPLLYSIYLAFVKWDLFAPHKEWVGLANFRDLWGDSQFWHAFGGTVKWTLGTLFVVDVLAPALAIFLNSGRVYLPGVFRMIFFIPVTMSLVAVGLMFSFIVSPAFGVFNELFSVARIRRSEPRSARRPELRRSTP